jgi:glycosyltransferase involved in cell wall biosynthesis
MWEMERMPPVVQSAICNLQSAIPKLWVDVGTLLGWRGQPAGIPRTLAQLVAHWRADPRVPLQLCRYDRTFRLYAPVAADLQVCRSLRADRKVRRHGLAARRWLEGWALRLPPERRDLGWHLAQSARQIGRLGRDLLAAAGESGRHLLARCKGSRPGAAPFAPGDVLLLAGTGAEDTGALDVQAALKRYAGVRIAHLVYDITPLRCPHLCEPRLTRLFETWLPGVLSVADLVLTISEHSRRDIAREAARRGLALPPAVTVRLGDEPGDGPEVRPAQLPGWVDGPFVLYVSTLGLHKNQGLLLHVWRRLLERHGDAVGPLLLVGGPGWRAEEFVRDLHADDRLARHVLVLSGVNDAGLRWLYRRCRFTVYPSLYEGWGLPVAESLVHGKACIAADASSLPEVGGDLVDYHDPLDGAGCLALVEKALFEPGWLAGREERIRRRFRPTGWAEAARRMFELLAAHLSLNARQAA